MIKKIINKITKHYIQIGICTILPFLIIIIYSKTMYFDFVSFDDGRYVYQNEHVMKGLSLENIVWAFGITDISYWSPLTWISHMMDCQLFGLDPGKHHLINVMYHIINTILLFIVILNMTQKIWHSAFVAAMFAIHPINVETVAWISERKNLLSTFFWLLTMLIYAWYVKKPQIKRYVFIFICLGFGLLSKPTLVTLPFVFLLLDYWPLNRIKFQNFDKNFFPGVLLEEKYKNNHKEKNEIKYKIQRESFAFLFCEKIPLIILSIISVFISSISHQHHNSVITFESVPIMLRISNALVSYMSYIGKMIYPSNLSVFYPYPDFLPWWMVAGSGLWMLCISILSVIGIKRYPFFMVGWFWFVGTLIPFSGLMQAGLWPAIADRWAYVPYIGLYILMAWGFPLLLKKWRFKEKILIAGTLFIIMILSLITYTQTQHWRDSHSLYKHAIEVSKNNPDMNYNLGVTLYHKGNIVDGFFYILKAVQISPGKYSFTQSLEAAYKTHFNNDRIITIIKSFEKEYANDHSLHYSIGNMYKSNGELEKAIKRYNVALSINPDFIEAMNNLALVYLDKKQYKKTFDLFIKITEKKTADPAAYYYIACIYSMKKNIDESLKWLKKAVANGFNNKKMIKEDGRLDNIRKRKEYNDILKSI